MALATVSVASLAETRRRRLSLPWVSNRSTPTECGVHNHTPRASVPPRRGVPNSAHRHTHPPIIKRARATAAAPGAPRRRRRSRGGRRRRPPRAPREAHEPRRPCTPRGSRRRPARQCVRRRPTTTDAAGAAGARTSHKRTDSSYEPVATASSSHNTAVTRRGAGRAPVSARGGPAA